MTEKSFRRAHLRAPLNTGVLYVDGEYVHRCKVANISEGGILLTELPHIPEINAIPLMLCLPRFPEFSTCSHETLLAASVKDFPMDVLRVRARMVRQFDKKAELDAIFTKNIGCQFVLPTEIVKGLIASYVRTMAKNTIFLLGLFEQKTKNDHNIKLIRKVAGLLGHNEDEKLSLLRLKVLHDYQSLESL
ncbi:type IV pilus assembly protein PilZ [Bacteriovorax sp. BSW11_IV]|uniref:PilZ domain-containing protein n=1 Tax=Bacteriovorax sp. BSW11_IV TaxID=1353529 RepID=UPI00038A267D|nr:PilZ domain-containing protein [Bacteriovorax sp. BSW11_IV]EQC48154.1 type IV pilus assembly protein PilZ [Bacteriovorax sp. BSW11_IV]